MPSLNEQREASGREFLIVRAQAIDAYAGIEQALSFMLASFAETSLPVANVILFRIGAHPRNLILDELRENKFGDQHKIYYKSLTKLLRQLDQTRNNIIHWHATINLSPDDVSVGLSRPSTWHVPKETSGLSIDDMKAFTAKCGFVGRSINMFTLFLRGDLQKSPDAHATWREICQRPVDYPPTSDHPLYRSLQVPEAPPSPSQE